MANNKVQLSDGTVLLDLTGDTVTPETLMAGVIAHNAAGERIVGICVAKEFNVDGSVVKLVDVPSRTMQQEGSTLKLSPAAINEHTLTTEHGRTFFSSAARSSPASACGALTARFWGFWAWRWCCCPSSCGGCTTAARSDMRALGAETRSIARTAALGSVTSRSRRRRKRYSTRKREDEKNQKTKQRNT